MDEIQPSDLNGVARTIAAHLGIAAAKRVIDVFPGYRLFVPRRGPLPADHPLRALGDPLAEKMLAHFSGEHLDIPTKLLSKDAIARRVHDLAGQSPRPTYNDIAGLTGLTRAAVQRILSRPRPGAARRPGLRRPADERPPVRQLDLVDWIEEVRGDH
jgi:hypothetical protein